MDSNYKVNINLELTDDEYALLREVQFRTGASQGNIVKSALRYALQYSRAMELRKESVA